MKPYLCLLSACLVIHLHWVEPTKKADDQFKLEALKSRARSLYHRRRQAAWAQCSDQPQYVPAAPAAGAVDATFASESSATLKPGRGRRATSGYSRRHTTNTAVYLSASRGQWNVPDRVTVPDHVFSVALWCKPDGGQYSPAVILEARDLCVPFPDRGWTLGIHSPETSGERDMKLYFTLHSWSRPQASVLTSPIPVKFVEWTHVAVTFDGETARFYQNGAQVAVIRDQGTSPPVSPACRTLYLGGDHGNHYRGYVDDLRVWNIALSPEDIRKIANGRTSPSFPVRPKLFENFSRLDSWMWSSEPRDIEAQSVYTSPVLVSSDVPYGPRPIVAKRNPCGFTVCDNPEVVRAYNEHWVLRKPKVLRYRVVVISDNDGSNPTVTKDQIRNQHDYLSKAFLPYNITWELEETAVKNSSLRKRVVLLGCSSSMVGNGQCDPECRHPSTGNDGGDCGSSSSYRRRNHLRFDQSDYDENIADDCYEDTMLGNGFCDDSCNNAAHHWDGGDCCVEDGAPECYDPSSPHRLYMDVKELKLLLRLRNTRHINVLFAQWTSSNILGVATFPWEKHIFGELGGVVLQSSQYGVPGQMSTLVHELGHALGLWHVHRGVSEMECSHACYEREASLLHGDLCGDTNPTPENGRCQDPPTETASVCGTSKFVNTPYTNYMGYGNDLCVEEFTDHQVARMHCHIDLLYSSAIISSRSQLLSPPLLLEALSSTPNSTALSWIPSLATNSLYDTDVCTYCSDVLEYTQYANKAESNGESSSSGIWQPDEATGPPDAEPCVLSYKMWLPDSARCPNNICTLTVYLATPVIPSLLQLWVTWNAHNGLENIELVFQDGSSDVIGRLPAQCDVPVTIPVSYTKAVTKIHIRTSYRFVGIDAVKVVSTSSNPMCSPCKPVKYRISREPPFRDGKTQDVDFPIFTDSEVEQGKRYTYTVQEWLGSRQTEVSPPFHFVAGSPICGDGKLDQSEDCDDGGLVDGDGCSSSCTVESGFRCKGEPSLCYWHEGDGLCEDYEREASSSDCGFYTPPGFTDQWGYDAKAGPEQDSCPANVIVGPPRLPLTCFSGQISETSWSPCGFVDEEYWLSVTFRKPAIATSILLYLTSDGAENYPYSLSKPRLRLLDHNGRVHHEQEFQFRCDGIRPQEVPILKDLSKSFAKTASANFSFANSEVAVAAVKMRSSNVLAPLDVGECGRGEQYHPGLQECRAFCKMASCPATVAKHATLNCTGREDGDTCTVLCNPGHMSYEELSPLVCRAGVWKGPEPSCKPLDCGMPLIAHADAVCPEGTSYGKVCSYKCRPPARFIGGGNGLATVTCEANGRWSTPNLICQVTCPPPSSTVSSVFAGGRCKRTESFTYGQTCRFRCKQGFHVEGMSTRRRQLHLRCDHTATWVGPTCVPVTCPAIEIPHNCTATNHARSECTVACPTQQPTSVVHRCEMDGAWNPPIPLCIDFPVCPYPQSKDKNVQFLCEGTHAGALCKTGCIQSDLEPVKPNHNRDRLKIKCAPNGSWYPYPDDIVCKRKCTINNIADGYCDAKNNQEHCGWDGGDCCPSTAPRRTVIPFPEDCGAECACLDPKAKENVYAVNQTTST